MLATAQLGGGPSVHLQLLHLYFITLLQLPSYTWVLAAVRLEPIDSFPCGVALYCCVVLCCDVLRCSECGASADSPLIIAACTDRHELVPQSRGMASGFGRLQLGSAVQTIGFSGSSVVSVAASVIPQL